jgi:hypothetical protein
MSAPYYTSSSPIPYRIICHLSTSIIENLKVGLNFVNVSEIIRLLIYQNEDKNLIIS